MTRLAGKRETTVGSLPIFGTFLPQVPPRFKSLQLGDKGNGLPLLPLGLPLHPYPVRKAGIRVRALALLLTR